MGKQQSGFIEELYAFWRSHADEGEVGFYREEIIRAGGKALELACGGGRLLLNFLKEGLDVEGVEASESMRALLKERAHKMGLTPKIYEQRIENVEIRHIYKLLYIPLGSFQFIARLDEARIALLKYYNLLEEGGKLIIPLSIPLEELIVREQDQWVIVSDVTDKKRSERVVKRENNWHDLVDQRILSQMRIELWNGRDLLEMTEKEIEMRWYSHGEFEFLLQEAGFRQIEMRRAYQEDSEEELHSFMLFVATK